MWYPLKFKPVFKESLWGGRNLEKLGKILPEGIIGESWELSCHPDGISIVANGELAGTPLPLLLGKFGRDLAGDALPEKQLTKFPLLIKFIDAKEWLSVQVHPDDGYAGAHENGQSGKTEMWYILSARPGAQLVHGTVPGVARLTLARSLREGNIAKCLNYIRVSPGDAVYIPAGLLHAVGKGILLAEIQQSSNLTYRVFDYDRVDRHGQKRPLHLEKALEVIRFIPPPGKIKGLEIKLSPEDRKICLVACAGFAAELYLINNEAQEKTDDSKFFVYIFTAGEGIIEYGSKFIHVKRGDTVLIPAVLGSYRLKGRFEALKTYVPHLGSDIIKPLHEAGHTMKQIKNVIIKGVWT